MPHASKQTRFKLIALDIDGTVLNSAQQVTPELKEALARLAGRSLRTVLCTGRRWQTTAKVLNELVHVHPVAVCSGGSLIKRADDERTLHATPLEQAPARLVVDLLRRAGLVALVLYDRPLGGRELKVSESEREQAERLPYLLANPGSCEFYAGDYPSGGERPLVVYAVDEGVKVYAAERLVREALGASGIVEAMKQPRYGADQVALEVHDPSATKWRALEWLIGQWGIRPQEVLAMGDDVNDIPMLKAAGLSFAMGNASDEVKAAAHAVTAGNDEHGVVLALKGVFGF